MFILYELLKLFMAETYWRTCCIKLRSRPVRLLDYTYLIYLIVLFFTPYWYVGLSVLIVSIITAFQTSEDVIEKSKFNKRIRGYLIADGVVSILLLLIVVFKETIL